MSNYIALVNRLRNRLNEIQLTNVTWNQTVGFDQFTKEAIMSAHDDIINAEMEWPFLHQTDTFLTTPGTQLYIPSVTVPENFNAGVKEIDWEGFYINDNPTLTTVTHGADVPSTAPYTITVTQQATFRSVVSVLTFPALLSFTETNGDPTETRTYNVINGVFYFSAADAGQAVLIRYQTYNEPSVGLVNKKWLKPIDYDYWRQNLLSRDMTFVGTPDFVFETQTTGQIGLSPVPDKVYSITLEYWLSPEGFTSGGERTDELLIPVRFENVIIDGALKYCYEFREDAPLAAAAEKRFITGIQRMRTELINRAETMKTGFQWRRSFGPFGWPT